MICDVFTNFTFSDYRVISPEENSVFEYKESFSWANKEKYARAMAAFANSSGGFLIFGIKDDNRELVGLIGTKFEDKDPAVITTDLNTFLNPAIKWDKGVCFQAGKKLGVIQVYESENKPVIAIKNGEEIREGEIYFRYGGKVDRIKHAELRNIIEREKMKYGSKLLEKMRTIVERGPDNVGIVNFEELRKSSEGDVFVIDPNAVSSEMAVRKAGENETKAGVAVRVIQALGTPERVIVEKLTTINTGTIFQIFLKRMIPKSYDPLLFLEQMPYESSGYVPIYFFMKQAGKSKSEFAKIVETSKSTTRGRTTLLNRLRSGDKDFSAPHYGNYFESKFKDLTEFEGMDKDASRSLLQSIRSMNENKIEEYWVKISEFLKYCFDNFYAATNLKNEIRLTFCYLDTKLYS